MQFSYRDDKTKWLRLVDEMQKMQDAELHVGVVGPEAESVHDEKSGATVADIAAIHEFGLGVPMRSWLRGWADEQPEAIFSVMQGQAKLVVSGKLTAQQAFDGAGAKYVGLIQKRIAERIDPPLAEVTIMKKGSDVPLIDTGVFRSSITWLTVGAS